MNADKRGYYVCDFLSAKNAKNHSYIVSSFFAYFAFFADNIVLICVYLRSSVDVVFNDLRSFACISGLIFPV
jgi:hypothetical protein